MLSKKIQDKAKKTMLKNHGVDNPFKNKERYLMLSEVNRKVVETMHDKDVFNFFVKAI